MSDDEVPPGCVIGGLAACALGLAYLIFAPSSKKEPEKPAVVQKVEEKKVQEPKAEPAPTTTQVEGPQQPVEKPAAPVQQSIEGKIIEVERTFLTFENTASGSLGSHPFKYVYVKDVKGDLYVLIQPNSNPVLKGDARILYDPLGEKPTLQAILDRNSVEKPKYHAVPDAPIKAKGFVKDIEYKSPKEEARK